MAHGLPDFQKGKKLSVRTYTTTIAGEIAKLGKHLGAIEEMHDEGYLEDRDYENIQHDLYEHLEKHGRAVSRSGLEKLARKVAAILVLLVGVVIAATSAQSITGGVIGTESSPTLTFIFGCLLFIFGLAVYPRK